MDYCIIYKPPISMHTDAHIHDEQRITVVHNKLRN